MGKKTRGIKYGNSYKWKMPKEKTDKLKNKHSVIAAVRTDPATTITLDLYDTTGRVRVIALSSKCEGQMSDADIKHEARKHNCLVDRENIIFPGNPIAKCKHSQGKKPCRQSYECTLSATGLVITYCKYEA